ncbi:hypothetical protein [uncultured Clostridium sp.]|uniref:hypothetical protein n=1 Tax=uncultured Clostridium sp. TaxID=59620 RepID=UPI0032162EA0
MLKLKPEAIAMVAFFVLREIYPLKLTKQESQGFLPVPLPYILKWGDIFKFICNSFGLSKG